MQPTARSNSDNLLPLPLISIFVLLLACIFSGGCVDRPLGRKYAQIHKGMKQADVESILGKGMRLKLDEVAQTPNGPVVEGKEVYEWKDKQDEEIWVGFSDGQVKQTFYYQPSF